jgi:sigma-B regulation protein RsbU (phosphoserine phosphatase)
VARDSQLLLTGTTSRAAVVRRWIAGTFAGRALAIGTVVKLVAFVVGLAVQQAAALGVVDAIGDICLVSGAAALLYRLFVDARRRLLWRVRRKLTISYIFIGVVPALLIITFFVLGGLVVFFNIGAYAMTTRLDALVERAHFIADSAVIELQHVATPGGVAEVLRRRHAAASPRHPPVSFALVAGANQECTVADGAGTELGPAAVGAWAHAAVPREVPAWVPCDGHAGLVTYVEDGLTRAAARALVWVPGTTPPRAVIVDIPVDAALVEQLRQDTGIEIGGVAATATGAEGMRAAPPPDLDTRGALRAAPESGSVSRSARALTASERLPWPALVDHISWRDGTKGTLVVELRIALFAVYDRIFSTRFGDFSVGQVVLVLLAVVGTMFLVIQSVALLMGLGLARSITGAVHELFVGTERVRRGDFGHKIAVTARDQLGELAASFNSMTASIEDLLQQKAEKERLEQELRIARGIQMSLLPQGTLTMAGIGLMAHCEPAREVGGDYYDFLAVDDQTLGVLIADVSGKGTSAALYMAVLKGIVLSLSGLHTSPRQLLIDANRIISRHLDSRSFITVSYALVDLRTRTLRYARAGHCPLIYVPGSHAVSREPVILTPDGMVLGLKLDEGQMFARLLDEITIPLGPGDLFLLYTDGISETMNADGDCFGDTRLADALRGHDDLPPEALMARILDHTRGFAGDTSQQDDMTMVLVRVDESGTIAVVSQ